MRWEMQYYNQYEQKEDYHFVTHGNEEEVMRQNSNAFSLLEEGGLDTSVLVIIKNDVEI